MPGFRHIFGMSKEYIPPFAYGGYYTRMKHPWMRDMERTYGIMMETGIVQVQ